MLFCCVRVHSVPLVPTPAELSMKKTSNELKQGEQIVGLIFLRFFPYIDRKRDMNIGKRQNFSAGSLRSHSKGREFTSLLH